MRHRDIWREQHADESGAYTVWDERTNARAANRGLRIDYILCSEGMAAAAGRCEIEFDMPRVRVEAAEHGQAVGGVTALIPHARATLTLTCNALTLTGDVMHNCDAATRAVLTETPRCRSGVTMRPSRSRFLTSSPTH